MKPNNHANPDHLFQQVGRNTATSEEMEQAENLLQHMEQRLEKQINHWETIERATERRSISTTFKWIAGIAASLLLILAVSLATQQQQFAQLQLQEDTYDNPEDAAAEAERALLKFSEAINKAIE